MSKKILPKDGHVFVATYGSLRRGMHNFGVNANGGGEYLLTGETLKNYNLYRYAGAYFPSVSLAHSSNNTPVVVDVFQVPEEGLTGAYDRLEGYYGDGQDNFYNRTMIEVMTSDGDILNCWIYHIDEEQDELVESGDWCTHNNPDYYAEIAND